MRRTLGNRNLLYFLILAALFLTACNETVTITPVSRQVLEAILLYFVTTKSLELAGNREKHREHRHRGYFVWRRARFLGERNEAWVNEPDHTTLKNRVNSEYEAVLAYLQAKIGTRGAPGPMYGGDDPTSPAHLDIDDVTRIYTSDQRTSRRVRRRRHNYREARRLYTRAIVWRAAAIQDELWEPAPDGRTATLKTTEMNEVLDRRMRVVERMAYNVSSAGAMGGRRWPRNLPDIHGPWKDGFRVRMFEYPRVPKRRPFTALLGGSSEWRLGERGTRFEYDVTHVDDDGVTRRTGIYFPPSQARHWRSTGAQSYRQFLSPSGRAAAQVIDDMLVPNPPDKWEDWWERTWLWCDHVIAALHMESLLFGKRRRGESDDVFNDLVDDDYVSLGAVVGMASRPVDTDQLMADDDDPFFENTVVDVEDLQVGDHLIFWNSFIYRMISRGDWRLENAIVMTIDSDPEKGIAVSGTPPSLQMTLQGHGTPRRPYGGFTNIIAGKLRGAMQDVQNQIQTAVSDDPTIISDPAKRRLSYSERPTTQLVWWSPYEEFRSPGAWWIEIPRNIYRDDWLFQDVEQAVQGIKKAVGQVTDGGTRFLVINQDSSPTPIAVGSGYNELPDTDAVYFPVFEPRVPSRWNGYLAARSANPSATGPGRLARLRVDGQIMPGIYYRGVSQPVPIVRPRVN